MNREERKWFPQKPKCEGGVGGFVSIGITECRYAFAMFGFGLIFALAVLCVELTIKYVFNPVVTCKCRKGYVTSNIK